VTSPPAKKRFSILFDTAKKRESQRPGVVFVPPLISMRARCGYYVPLLVSNAKIIAASNAGTFRLKFSVRF